MSKNDRLDDQFVIKEFCNKKVESFFFELICTWNKFPPPLKSFLEVHLELLEVDLELS